MAASGYTPISLYYSTTASAVPTAGNLANGELALNIADMKLYAKNSSGVVTLLASNASTTGVDSLSFGSTGLTPSTATTGAITVAGTLATTNGGTGLTSFTSGALVYASSTSALTTSSALTFSGTTLNIAGGNVGISASTGNLYLDAASGASVNLRVSGYTAGVQILSTSAITLNTGSAERVRIDTAGYVGIGTNSPTTRLQIGDATVSTANKITFGKTTATTEATLPTVYAGSLLVPAASVDLVLEAGSTSGGIAIRTAGSTRAVVDSSGNVGIGTSSPSYKLQAVDNGNIYATSAISNSTAGTSSLARFLAISDAGNAVFAMTSSSYTDVSGAQDAMLLSASNASGGIAFALDGTLKMKLDSAGNLGLGVTPSAWGGGKKVLQASNASFAGQSDRFEIWANAYYDGSAVKYISNGYATLYQSVNGAHSWQTAASGTAGGTVTLTQAMTLDASSRLMLGTTTASSISASVSTLSIGGTSASVSGGIAYQTNGTVKGYHYVDSDYLYHQSISSGHLFLATNTERFRIGPAGQIGLSGANYGTSGQVLTSAGSGAAPTWASPSGGSWVYLATVSASAAATVSFNSTYITSTYDAYVVVFSGWYPDVDRPQYYLRLSTDNNSTFVTCNFITVRADSASVQSSATLDSNIRLVSPGTFSTSASNGGGSGCVWIYNPSSTSSGRTVTWTLGGYSTNSSDQESWYGSGTYRNTTTAINAIRFLQGSGNITGKFVLYGVKAS